MRKITLKCEKTERNVLFVFFRFVKIELNLNAYDAYNF